jgi:hypothetical protein
LRLSLVTLAATATATTAAAQEYQTDKVDAQAKRNAGIVLSTVRNPSRYAADKAKFVEYFTGYYFPAMTQTDPDALANLGDLRYDLFRKYLWATNHEPLQSDLTELAFNAARKMVGAANPPYHPAVRYNAVLILGQLDKQYAIETVTNRRPPVPLPEATKLLTQILNLGVEDKRIPPSITLGALIGLERHARYRDALAPEAVDAMTAALLKLVRHEQPIHDMDRESHDWLRLRAASVLAQLGSVGPNNEVHEALVKLIGDFKALDDRTATAALLARIKYEGAKLDGAAAVEQLFKLARDLGAAEAKRAEEFQNARLGSTGGFGPMRGEMFTPYSPSGEGETFPRRHVLARLIDLRAALRAVKPIVAEDTQSKIDELIKAIQPVITAAADKDTVELKLAATIHTMAAAIERTATPPEKPAADAEEEAEEEAEF